MFSISSSTLNSTELSSRLMNDHAGALVTFEGWVRDHNEGKKVSSLEYQVYAELALKEGNKILAEAQEKFNLHGVMCVHREGHLQLGECAIWIGATASHRDDAFKATRYVIDEIKHRLPVWKKEHYVNQAAEWVFCRHHHHHVHFEEREYYQKQHELIDQNKLKSSKVLVVGAGGLGCPALVSLATAGVGEITIVDPDTISISNIHRQFLFAPNLVGEKKVVVAKNRLVELNPFITVHAQDKFFRPEMVNGMDLVLDCTDNMRTKFFIHDACLKFKVPLITAGVYKHEGQIRTIKPGEGCLRCFGKTTPDDSLLGNCNDFGVIGATTSVLGSMQASEALNFLNTGTNASLVHTVLLDLKTLAPIKFKNVYDAHCVYCTGNFELVTSLEVDEIGEAMMLDIRHLSDDEIEQMNFSEKKVVLCCHKGNRSHKVASKLRQLGHQHIYSLKGGAELHSIGEARIES